MTQPTPYNPIRDYSDDEAGLVAGRSTLLTAGVDGELNAISTTIGQILTNLAILQRDDTLLANKTVHKEALDDTVLAMLVLSGEPKGSWVTDFDYLIKDLVSESGITYVCTEPHKSGVFATDLAADKWLAIAATYPIATITAAAQASADAAAASETQTGLDAIATAADVVTAQAIVDSIIWKDVQFKSFADTPITISQSDDGTLISIDTSGGNVVINLGSVASLVLPYTITLKKSSSDTNTVTINPNGTDTIDGSSSLLLETQGDGATLIPDVDTSPDTWVSVKFGLGISLGGNNTWLGANSFSGSVGGLLRGGIEVATVADLIPNTDTIAKVSANDTTAGFLNGKLIAGSGVTLTENNDGGNETLTISSSGVSAGSVGQAQLKTTTGIVSTSATALTDIILPGGSYGFYPQVRNAGSGDTTSAQVATNVGSTSYVTNIALATTTGALPAYAQQRYVQASAPYNLGFGDIPLFVFATIDNATGKILSTYIADTPPWVYNGPTQAAAEAYNRNGQQLRKKRVGGAIFNNRLRNRQSREAYLLRKESIRGQYEVITQAVKNADMALIPHPFKAKAGETIVSIDPLGDVVDKLAGYMEDGEEVTDILRNYINVNNTPIGDAGFDGSVTTVAASWKN